MSGGSYDYLYCKEPSELLSHKHLVKKMIEDIRKYHKMPESLDAADELDKLYLDLEMFERMISNRLERLKTLLKVMERWSSGDDGEDDFVKAWKDVLEAKA